MRPSNDECMKQTDLNKNLLQLVEEVQQLKAELQAAVTLLSEEIQAARFSEEQLLQLIETVVNQKLIETEDKAIQTIQTQEPEPEPEPETIDLQVQAFKEDDYAGQKVWYADIPVNNTFLGPRIYAHFIPRKTFYRIIPDEQESMSATLDLVSDSDTLMVAFNVPDSYLAACEIRGVGVLSYDRMKGRRPGRVVRDGGNWVVVERIGVG